MQMHCSPPCTSDDINTQPDKQIQACVHALLLLEFPSHFTITILHSCPVHERMLCVHACVRAFATTNRKCAHIQKKKAPLHRQSFEHCSYVSKYAPKYELPCLSSRAALAARGMLTIQLRKSLLRTSARLAWELSSCKSEQGEVPSKLETNGQY